MLDVVMAPGFSAMSRFMSVKALWRSDYADLRLFSLFLAIVVYALFGSPTPEVFGWPEAVTGAGLLFAVGFRRGVLSLSRLKQEPAWHGMARILLAYGLSVPVLMGLLSGNSHNLMIRDVIPFLFMLLPLWIGGLLTRKDWYLRLYTFAIFIVGIAFSVRVLMPLVTESADNIILLVKPADPAYLANAPTVLFTGMVLLGSAGMAIYHARGVKGLSHGFVFLSLSLVPILTMALIVQRASLGLTALMVAVLLIVGLWHRPLRTFVPFIIAVAITCIFWPAIDQIIDGLLRKNALVGFNMRWQEMMTVFDVLKNSWVHVLFGMGWGATIESPAVAGLTVNFTHSLITTYFLKSGLIGVMLALAYLFLLARYVWLIFLRAPVCGFALGSVLIIDIFLYASFKSLDFGLVLALIPLWANAVSRLQPPCDIR